MKSSRNSTDLPVLPFERQKDWAVWLDKNQATSSGVWLKLAKKASGIKSVTYDEALEVALCYGWIDGQRRSHDETSWLQKFTPRGPKSIWPKINRCAFSVLIFDQMLFGPRGVNFCNHEVSSWLRLWPSIHP